MSKSTTTYDLTPEELFRLKCAYTAIRDPKIRAEFLTTLEAWAEDQWFATDRES